MITNKQTLSVWKVREDKFPQKQKIEIQLKFLLHYAILAPSGHNTQPWKFYIEKNKLQVWADLDQSRKEVDPENRELYISVGCAITNLETAAKRFNLVWEENWWPVASKPNLVLEMEFKDVRRDYGEIEPLFEAITKRSTSRNKFDTSKEVDINFHKDENKWLTANGVKISWVKNVAEKEKVAQLVSSAQKIWFRSKKLTEELEFWLKKDITDLGLKKNGVVSLTNFSMNLKQFMGTEFKSIDDRAERDRKWLLEAPLVGVLWTKNDNLRSWVEAGRKYEYLCLWATSQNLQTGYFNSVAQLPKKRSELALILGERMWPQLLFRMGYGKRGRMSPRKNVGAVLM
ncbi:MAG: hypothetical protein WCT01_04535 [Candidatus Shapirobacteria bacterium]